MHKSNHLKGALFVEWLKKIKEKGNLALEFSASGEKIKRWVMSAPAISERNQKGVSKG